VVKALAAGSPIPAYVNLAPDWRTLLAGFLLSLFTVLLFGLVPALKISRQDLVSTIKEGGPQSGGAGRARLQQALVAAQVGASCALLVVAGLMVRGFQRVLAADPGFDIEKIAVLDPSLERHGIKGETARAYWSDVRQAIAAHPECRQAALASQAPFASGVNESSYRDAPGLKATNISVEPGFFPLMGIPLLAGRHFLPDDDHRTAVIVSRRLAERMYGTTDVLDRGFPKTRASRTIVGVVGDANLIKIHATNMAEEYRPLDPDGYTGAILIVRARTDSARLLEPMRAAARSRDERVLAATHTTKVDFERRLQAPRLSSFVAGVVGLLALWLACLGIFGLVSYGVTARTREIGIRVALGAHSGDIIGTVVQRLAGPMAAGVTFGCAAGMLAARLFAGEPFYLNPNDAIAPLAAVTVLVAAAGIAAFAPSRRALRINPTDALRNP
jgi:predicted permease